MFLLISLNDYQPIGNTKLLLFCLGEFLPKWLWITSKIIKFALFWWIRHCNKPLYLEYFVKELNSRFGESRKSKKCKLLKKFHELITDATNNAFIKTPRWRYIPKNSSYARFTGQEFRFWFLNRQVSFLKSF